MLITFHPCPTPYDHEYAKCEYMESSTPSPTMAMNSFIYIPTRERKITIKPIERQYRYLNRFRMNLLSVFQSAYNRTYHIYPNGYLLQSLLLLSEYLTHLISAFTRRFYGEAKYATYYLACQPVSLSAIPTDAAESLRCSPQ